MSREGLAARLLAIFATELEEQLRGMTEDLLALEAAPADAERLRSIFRAAHTLKGAAHAAGVPAVGTACHALEALLAQVRDGRTTLGEAEFEYLYAVVDALSEARERIRRGEQPDAAALASLASPGHGAGRGATAVSVVAPRGAPAAAQAPVPAAPGPAPAPAPAPGAPAARAEREDVAARAERMPGQVRVETDKMDALLSSVGELLVAVRRAAARPAQFEALHATTSAWARSWRRLSGALRAASADASVQRLLDEVEGGLDEVVRGAERAASEATTDTRLVSHLAGELGDRMRRLRMQPFETACDGLARAVRDLAAAGGKAVRLEIEGGEVEADRVVLDALREALLHLVRNAVDHGIEPPDAREQRGKARTGTVRISAGLRGDRLVVTVADDGAGLDVSAIRSAMEARGRPVPADDRAVAQALFGGGLSTRADPTEVSGRGVGLDAVRAAAERVRGSIDLTWREGEGTTFLLECPSTLAGLRVLLVRAGDVLAALPTSSVEHLHRVRPEEILRLEGHDVLPTPSGPVPVIHLARALGLPVPTPTHVNALPVVRIISGSRRLALVADDLLSEQEVVVRPLERLRTVPAHLTGAAILAEGEVALVLYPAALIAAAEEAGGARSGLAAAAPTTRRGRVLVADDSITTRTLEQSVLEAAGYEVTTAADGAEAWAAIQERPFDLVVSDVEMPRMDGFALCETIRASRRFAELPVVLVTALDSEEHVERGLEAGADAYIPKSSFDQKALLETVRELLGETG